MGNKVLGELIGLARATEGNDHLLTPDTYETVAACLVSEEPEDILLARIDAQKRLLVPMCYECASPCGRNNAYDIDRLGLLPENIRQLKALLLERCRVLAEKQPVYDAQAAKQLYLTLYAIGMEDWTEAELQPVLDQF